MGVDPDRNTKGSSQTKVCQFDNALVVNQQILWFQVTMEHSATVTEVDALQNLVKVALDQHRVHVLARGDGVQVFLQVHGQELEDEVETRFLH